MKRQWGLGFLGMLAMVLLLLAAYATINTSTIVDQNIQRTKDTKANTEQIEDIAERIISCTDPKGQCFKDGQQRTGDVVASINDVIIATAACDLGSTPLYQIRKCVRRSLRE